MAVDRPDQLWKIAIDNKVPVLGVEDLRYRLGPGEALEVLGNGFVLTSPARHIRREAEHAIWGKAHNAVKEHRNKGRTGIQGSG